MAAELERIKGVPFCCWIQPSLNIKFIFVALGFLLLAACGGGGGGGGGNSSLSMSVSSQTISVSAMTSQSAPTASVQVDVAGLSLNQEVYIGATYSGDAIFSAIPSGGTLPATVTIQFKSPANLGPGTYNGTVTVNVCLDQSCSQPLSNSPQTIQVQYVVTKSTFVLTSLDPSSAYVGTQGFTLTVNGSTFTSQSTVLWNGNSLPTTFVRSTQLTAQVPATDISTTGSATISVSDPTYGTSNTEVFTINPSPITITSLSPASINAEGPAFTLTLTGTSFTSQSTVLWSGNPQTTTFVSATQLTTQIPAADIATTGSATILVTDPTYGNSNSETFTITAPPLALNSISPTTVTVGGPYFMLTALGTAFTGTSTVEWNGTALATTQISATELIAQVPASDISATGTASVIVSDPNSPPGTTGAQTVSIAPPSIDAITFQVNPAHTGAVTFSSVSFPSSPTWSVNVGGNASYALIVDGKVIVTVELSSTSSEVLALDQATGTTVWGPILISSYANAAYDNGRVFVASENYPGMPVMEAFDVATGTLDWNTTLDTPSGFLGVPTAKDGIVYIEGTGGLEALDESNGTLLWTSASYNGGSTPAVTADGVYIILDCADSDLRPATGELIWKYAGTCGSSGAMPAIVNQLDYAPDGAGAGNILNAETGVSVGQLIASTPSAFTTTMGYFLDYSTLRGVTLANNTVQWTFMGDGYLEGSPIAVNQYVFIGSSLGNLYAVDSSTGKQVWTVNLGSAIGVGYYEMPFSGLAAGDGLLVVPSGTNVTAYTLSTNP